MSKTGYKIYNSSLSAVTHCLRSYAVLYMPNMWQYFGNSTTVQDKDTVCTTDRSQKVTLWLVKINAITFECSEIPSCQLLQMCNATSHT